MKKLTQNILVPTDFSASSLLAMGAARILASQNDAKITLVHVMDPTPLTIGAPGLGSMTEAEIEPEVEARVHAELTRVREEKLGDVDSVKTALVISRNAADGIVHYADKEGVDMIVMATHGRSGLTHFLIGSVAENVVRHANCPVLTLRSKIGATK